LFDQHDGKVSRVKDVNAKVKENKVVLVILLKVQQGKGKIVKKLWLSMATYENQKRHKVCFTKNFNFQKEYMYYIIYLFI
jgi:hypothetical protein